MRPGPVLRALFPAVVAVGIASATGGLASATTRAVGSEPWSQYQADAQHTGVASAAPAPPFTVAWSTPTGIGDDTHFAGIPAPVIGGDDAIVVDREDVSAVSLSSGSLAWSVPRELGPSAPAAVVSDGGGGTILFTEGGGDRSSSASGSPTTVSPTPAGPSPTASPGPASSDDRSTLVAIDAETHRVLWQTPLPGVSIGGPTVDGSTILVGTDDGSVTAVALDSGDQEWAVDLGDDVNTPIAVSDGMAFVAVSQGSGQQPNMIALRETDGSQVWSVGVGAVGLSVGAPAVADGSVFMTASDGSVRAIDAATGVASWATRLNTVAGGGAPAVSADAVIVVDIRGQVYRFAASTGDRVWDFAMNAPVYGSPVIAGGAVVVGDGSGDISAIDFQTGERIWRGNVGAGLLLGLAAAPDTIVASRTGPSAGLLALATDPNGLLIREQSPTIVDPADLGLAWVAAAIPLVVLLIVAGRFLDTRLGPATFDEDDIQPEDDET